MTSLKFKVFLVYEELEYRVLLPNDVNYSNLVRYVKKKFKLADGNQICLSYNIGSNHINIIDDDDVCYFVNEVSGQEVKKLYIKLVPKVRDVKRVYTPKDIAHDVNLEWNVYISYKKAWTGKQLALASTQGCPIESFAQLPFYCYNLKRENEGTVTDIDTDDEGRFKMCFIGFGVAIKSFLCYIRLLIIIDAAHLKETFLGTNLMAVGMDGNNQIIPIATGVSQGKTGESWTWFMRKLKECIGEVPNLTIISDRHYAITLACNTIFPNSFHGYCCRHLMMNCGMQSDKYKELYWKTCKAYTVQDFEKLMTDIHVVRPDAHQKLVEAGVEKWSRAKCTANRYNYMTSNFVESINALTKTVRKIPITSLMDWFRQLLQDWYYERRQKYEDTPDDELTPWASAKIKWQLSGLPCGHVCAVARVEGLTSVNNLAKPWFLNKTIKGTYAGLFFPMTDVSTWEIPNEIQQVLPPDMGKK
ncbi:transposase, MuDR, MULE transposase domain protein [Tanacetum coccineum]